MTALSTHPQPNDTWLNRCLGPDSVTRWRVLGVSLCLLVYAFCCVAGWLATQAGLFRPWALPALLMSIPINLVMLVLVRSGWSRSRADPALTMPQNILAMVGIGLAYIATGPDDRGIILILLTLVTVFGMYTHTPRQTLVVGAAGMVMLGSIMYVLTRWDPVYYPVARELIRFELLAGCLPVMVFIAYQLIHWRDRLRAQRAELAKALEVVQQLATRDALTGLVNRRHMQEKLEDCVLRSQRYGESFCVALIDLDHFKAVNDQHGHSVGDEVLIRFGKAAQRVLRESDTLARWGGEEFLILFPQTALEQAQGPLLRLQEALAGMRMSADLPLLRVAFSCGMASHAEGGTLDQTLEQADAALYQAKRTGRARVVFFAGR